MKQKTTGKIGRRSALIVRASAGIISRAATKMKDPEVIPTKIAEASPLSAAAIPHPMPIPSNATPMKVPIEM